MIAREPISDHGNLTVGVGTITYAIDVLLIDIEVETTTPCDNRNEVGLIQASVNCRVRMRGNQGGSYFLANLRLAPRNQSTGVIENPFFRHKNTKLVEICTSSFSDGGITPPSLNEEVLVAFATRYAFCAVLKTVNQPLS
jgi:hypothetical protein